MFSLLQAAIRKELNDFKSYEMEVHEESKQYTRYKNIKSTSFTLVSSTYQFKNGLPKRAVTVTCY